MMVLEKEYIAVCGGCKCGIGYIEVPDSLDSGTTIECVECQEPMIFDISNEVSRKKLYAEPSTKLMYINMFVSFVLGLILGNI